ncbi:MAG TPA: PDZ domain-containing protein [Gemmataceae bacterium]|nr:PDZ domain-containing protein [Gemmataceae bacterium]
MLRRILLFSTIIFVAANSLLAQERLAVLPKPVHQDVSPEMIARWVEQLGDKSFRTREDATRTLVDCEQAVPFVARAAGTSTNPEIRRRGAAIMVRFNERAWSRFQKEFPTLLQQHELDRLVDGMVFWRERLNKRCRDEIALLADDVMQPIVTGRLKKKPAINLRPDFLLVNKRDSFDIADSTIPLAERQLKGRRAPLWDVGSCQQVFAISRQIAADGSLRSCIFVSRDSARFGNLVECCALSNSSAQVAMTDEAFLFVDGDLVAEGIGDSIVFCTGKVTILNGGAYRSIVIAKGKITTRQPNGDGILLSNDTKSFGILRLYEPARMGIEVAADAERVSITRVLPDTQLRSAGVKVGDRIVAVGDDKVSSLAEMTKFLRRKSVEFLPFFITVERDGKTLELVVPSK